MKLYPSGASRLDLLKNTNEALFPALLRHPGYDLITYT
jgi:hypothetical protein